jgi:ATP-dependent Clp protease ATP-binding subunit ClpB
MEKHSVSRLIGAPPGYVGFDQGGSLTEAVRRKPYSVVLFDEVEKAHPDIFDLFLQMLDDGRLTDSHGRVVDFSHCLIIMTSNLGSQAILNESDPVQIQKQVMDAVSHAFKPELINRIDEIVIFHRLGIIQLEQILGHLIEDLNRLLKEKGLFLVLDKDVFTFLLEQLTQQEFGARPLKRIFSLMIQNPLAKAILTGRFSLEAKELKIRAFLQDSKVAFVVEKEGI